MWEELYVTPQVVGHQLVPNHVNRTRGGTVRGLCGGICLDKSSREFRGAVAPVDANISEITAISEVFLVELAGPRSDYIIIVYDSQTAASKVRGTGPVNKYGGLVGVTRVLLDRVQQRGTVVHWVWVKGHCGHPANERADGLATQGMYQEGMRRYRIIPPGHMTARCRYTSAGLRRREEEGRADATDSEEELDALLLEEAAQQRAAQVPGTTAGPGPAAPPTVPPPPAAPSIVAHCGPLWPIVPPPPAGQPPPLPPAQLPMQPQPQPLPQLPRVRRGRLRRSPIAAIDSANPTDCKSQCVQPPRMQPSQPAAKVLERDDRFRGDLDGTKTTRGGWTGDTAREQRRATAAHVTTARLSDSCAQVSQGPDTQVGEDGDVVYISEMAEGTQMED